MLKYILSIVFVFSSFLLGYSSNEFITRKYTTLNGLSQNDVQCIYKDSRGFIWLATNDGLNRFDGYDFKVYGYHSKGLTSNLILSIDEDSKGNLWIGTADRGIFLFKSEKDEFVHINLGMKSTIHNYTCDKLLVDSDDRVWLHTSLNKLILLKYDYSSQKVENVLQAFNDFPYVIDISEVDGQIYVSTENGIFRATNFRNELHLEPVLKNPVSAVGVISSSRLVISDLDHHEVFLLDVKTGQKNILLKDVDVRKLVYDKGHLYYATSESVYTSSLDLDKNQLYDISRISSYSYSYPQTMIIDKNDILWVGFFKSGFLSIVPDKKPILHYHHIGNNHVSSICAIDSQNIYLGTEGSGLYHFNRVTGEADLLPFSSNKIVYSVIHADYDDKIYASFMYSGLFRFDSKGACEKICAFRDIRTMLACGKYIWIGTYNSGLYRYDLSTGRMQGIYLNNKVLKIVRNLLKDSKGNIWVASSYGLKLIKASDVNSDTPALHSVKGLDAFDYIVPMCEDVNHDIWYGTLGRGLKKIVRLTDDLSVEIKEFKSENGLSNNTIKSIVNGKDGTLWIATNRGINSLNIQTEKIKSYDIYDGLQDYEFMELSADVLSGREMIFGGVNGINIFNPLEFSIEDFEARPVLVDFSIFNKSVEKDSTYAAYFDQSVSFISQIELPYNMNSFSFEFSGLDYANPNKLTYEYMLEGVDNSWVKVPADHREAFYTKLAYGNYVFRLRVANCDGVVSSNELAIPVVITPPFWLTWYAYLAYAVIFLIVLYQLKRYYMARVQRKNAVYIARMEKKKTEELLEKETAFFTNVSHELRTPLTLIHSPLKLIMDSQKYTSDKFLTGLLQTMEHNSHFLLRLVNQLMNFSKSEKGMLSMNLKYGNFSAFTKEVFQQFMYWAKQKDIRLEYSVSSNEICFLFDPHLMEQIIYNLVSNAIKHTPNGGFVSFSIRENDDKVSFSIADSGNGISEELKSHLFERFYSQSKNSTDGGTGIGLFLTKKLVEIHNGTISFVSEEGKGTVFHVEIPMITEGVMTQATPEQEYVSEEVATDKLVYETVQPSPAESSDQERSLILVVDDNLEICNMLSALLSPIYNIRTANDGETAWGMIPDLQPDLVLSDIMMPGLNGLQLCERIKQDVKTSHIPVVLLTAKTSLQDYLIGYRFQADAYCPKPFDNQILKELISSIIHNRKRVLRFKNLSSIKLSEVSMTSTDDKFLEKLIKIVEEHISDSSFQVEDLCNGVGVTALVLNKKLKALMGTTANAFVRSIRMKRAAELLKTGRYSVSEVTYDVGFNDLKYFRECFKKEFGVLPQQYKEQGASEENPE